MTLFTILSKPGKLVLLAALLFSFATLQAQTFEYGDAWGKAGMTLKSESNSGVNVNFSINEFAMEENMIDGTPMMNINLPKVFLPNNEGAPDLPGVSRYIAIPQGANVVLKVKNYRVETMTDVEIAPAPRIPLDTDKGPLHYAKDELIYTKNAYYPEQPFQLSTPTDIRGVDVVMLGITPFQYNPVTKELLIYRDVEFEVVFEGGNSHYGNDRLRSRWFDPILQDHLLNAASLPEVDYSARIQQIQNRDDVGYEYLIVVPNSSVWTPYAEQIKEWRTMQGILTGIVTLDDIGGTSASALETYFNNAYNTWDIPPVAVLIMADYGTNADNSIISPIWDGYCVSDNIWADVNNNDMPDIIFARMTAQNAGHLEIMVSKMLDYEADPPTDFNFYHKPVTALGWQTERWFQICSEVVGGYWREVKGKEPVRVNAIYSGSPGSTWSTNQNTPMVTNYFGPNGLGYIPATPAELGGWSGGTAQDVINALNDGAFALQHRDHGSQTGWGEPGFQSSHISSLTNNADNELSFIFSINCLTGMYDMSGECFAEKFHRHTSGGLNAGALGLIAASEVSYSFVNDTYVWGMMDNMYPDFMPDYGNYVDERGFLPAFGNAAGKYFLQQSNWPYNTSNKEVTYNLFHHHGGAFLQVYTEVPQNMVVNHNPILYSGESVFTVVADEGAFIALTVDGEIIGIAQSAGGATNITIEPQLPPAQMIVTVTKQDYFRYEGTVDVIPPEGPYVVGDSFVINDASGNNNGMMDYGESITLNMTMKNVGVEQAQNVNVTMTTSDPYVTITDGTHYFGNIDPDGTVTINNAFALDCDENIPDNHTVSFELSSTDGTDVWISYISIKGHAPKLEYVSYSINDSGGNNNGFLDPGETAAMTVTVENGGSADAYDVVAQLTSSDPLLVVLTTQPQNIGDLSPEATGEATFNVYASPDIQPGYTGELSILFTADMGVSQEDIIQIPFADYCEATTNTEDEWIAQVICGEIDNSSGWQGAVANYTDITTTLIPGVGEPITIENGNAWASDIVYVWVDWNLDKELGNDPNEEFQLTNVGGSGQTFTGEITPPANQMNGQFRMRVRMTYSSAPVPCGNSSYGEVEDYTVLIGSQVNLDPPQNIGVSLTGNDVTISWDAPAGRDVSGYNVYRDGEMISAMVTNMYYTDMDCPDGSYWYSASAVYPEGESGIADPVQVTVGDLTGKIQGFIRDAITNALIPNAWVSALAADFGAVTYNTPFGSHFSLFLPGGTYDLVCDADGYMPQNLNNITIANGGLFSHVFYLFPESFAPDTKGNMFNHSADGSVAIYPNPATNEVNVEVIGSLQQVKIMNNLGQVVFNEITEGQSLKINTSDFLKGIYFIEIHTVEGLNTEKLVIK